MNQDKKPDVWGDLQRYPLPRMFFYLLKKKFTGVMSISADSVPELTGHIFLRQGAPVFAAIPSPEDKLSKILVEKNMIDEAYAIAWEAQLDDDDPSAWKTLYETSGIDTHLLDAGRSQQLERKVNRLFSLLNGDLAIYHGEHQYGLPPYGNKLQVDTLQIIHQGVLQNFSPRRMKPELDKIRERRLSPKPELSPLIERYEFSNEEKELIKKMYQQPLTIEELYDATGLGPMGTQTVIYVLWVTEVLNAEEIKTSAQLAAERQAGLANLILADSEAGKLQQRSPSFESKPVITASMRDSAEFRAVGKSKASAGSSQEMRPIQDSPKKPPSGPSAPLKQKEPNAPIEQIKLKEPSAPSAPLNKKIPSGASAPINESPAASQHRKLIKETFAHLSEQNHFEVLGVSQSATAEQIREAYFKLAKTFHPDRGAALGVTDMTNEAAEVFRRIGEAHTTLTNADSRRQYEAQLSGKSGDRESQEAQKALQAEIEFQKGMVWLRKKNFAEAHKSFAEAYRLNDQEGEHLAYMAWSQFCDPKIDRSTIIGQIREQLLRALKLSPNNVNCHHFLGEIYIAQDEPKKARYYFEKVLELKPDHLEASRHLRLLSMRKGKDSVEGKKLSGMFKSILGRDKDR